MAYGDLPSGAAHKPNKGLEGGACNRERCQAEPALFYNHGSHAWYCGTCATDIGLDHVNLRHWNLRWRPECGHAQFETRAEMDEREAAKPVPPPRPPSFRDIDVPLPRVKRKSASLERLLKRAKK